MKRKLLSMLLALAMVLTLLPTAALAGAPLTVKQTGTATLSGSTLTVSWTVKNDESTLETTAISSAEVTYTYYGTDSEDGDSPEVAKLREATAALANSGDFAPDEKDAASTLTYTGVEFTLPPGKTTGAQGFRLKLTPDEGTDIPEDGLPLDVQGYDITFGTFSATYTAAGTDGDPAAKLEWSFTISNNTFTSDAVAAHPVEKIEITDAATSNGTDFSLVYTGDSDGDSTKAMLTPKCESGTTYTYGETINSPDTKVSSVENLQLKVTLKGGTGYTFTDPQAGGSGTVGDNSLTYTVTAALETSGETEPPAATAPLPPSAVAWDGSKLSITKTNEDQTAAVDSYRIVMVKAGENEKAEQVKAKLDGAKDDDALKDLVALDVTKKNVTESENPVEVEMLTDFAADMAKVTTPGTYYFGVRAIAGDVPSKEWTVSGDDKTYVVPVEITINPTFAVTVEGPQTVKWSFTAEATGINGSQKTSPFSSVGIKSGDTDVLAAVTTSDDILALVDDSATTTPPADTLVFGKNPVTVTGLTADSTFTLSLTAAEGFAFEDGKTYEKTISKDDGVTFTPFTLVQDTPPATATIDDSKTVTVTFSLKIDGTETKNFPTEPLKTGASTGVTANFGSITELQSVAATSLAVNGSFSAGSATIKYDAKFDLSENADVGKLLDALKKNTVAVTLTIPTTACAFGYTQAAVTVSGAELDKLTPPAAPTTVSFTEPKLSFTYADETHIAAYKIAALESTHVDTSSSNATAAFNDEDNAGNIVPLVEELGTGNYTSGYDLTQAFAQAIKDGDLTEETEYYIAVMAISKLGVGSAWAADDDTPYTAAVDEKLVYTDIDSVALNFDATDDSATVAVTFSNVDGGTASADLTPADIVNVPVAVALTDEDGTAISNLAFAAEGSNAKYGAGWDSTGKTYTLKCTTLTSLTGGKMYTASVSAEYKTLTGIPEPEYTLPGETLSKTSPGAQYTAPAGTHAYTVTLNDKIENLEAGNPQTITLTISPKANSAALAENNTVKIVWSTSNNKVATVAPKSYTAGTDNIVTIDSGMITGGKVTVTAEVTAVGTDTTSTTATITATVTAGSPADATFEPSAPTCTVSLKPNENTFTLTLDGTGVDWYDATGTNGETKGSTALPSTVPINLPANTSDYPLTKYYYVAPKTPASNEIDRSSLAKSYVDAELAETADADGAVKVTVKISQTAANSKTGSVSVDAKAKSGASAPAAPAFTATSAPQQRAVNTNHPDGYYTAEFEITNHASGITYDVYDVPTGGTALATVGTTASGTVFNLNSTTALVSGASTTYYVAAVKEGVASATRTALTVTDPLYGVDLGDLESDLIFTVNEEEPDASAIPAGSGRTEAGNAAALNKIDAAGQTAMTTATASKLAQKASAYASQMASYPADYKLQVDTSLVSTPKTLSSGSYMVVDIAPYMIVSAVNSSGNVVRELDRQELDISGASYTVTIGVPASIASMAQDNTVWVKHANLTPEDKLMSGPGGGKTIEIEVSSFSLFEISATRPDGSHITAVEHSSNTNTGNRPTVGGGYSGGLRSGGGVSVVVPGASTVGGFSDVPTTHSFAAEIAWAQSNGIMGGYSDGTFRPGANTTRQALWMVLGRMAGAYPADMAAARAWSINAGISDGSKSEGNMSRQQMITMLYRFAQMQGLTVSGSADISGFSDSGIVADYAKEALAWGVANGIITGTNDGRLNPEGTATRAHFAAFMYRFASLDLAAPAGTVDET